MASGVESPELPELPELPGFQAAGMDQPYRLSS
jgi:hypothetical protein